MGKLTNNCEFEEISDSPEHSSTTCTTTVVALQLDPFCLMMHFNDDSTVTNVIFFNPSQ